MLQGFSNIRLALELRRGLWAVMASTGVHVVLLVGLGLAVGGSRAAPIDVTALLAEIGSASASDTVLDTSEIVVCPLPAAASEPATVVAAAARSSELAAEPALLHRAAAKEWGEVPSGGDGVASPFDAMGVLGPTPVEGPPAPTAQSPLAGGSGNYFFGVPSQGERIVFVVDISGSMHGRRFRRARNELRHSIESLRPTQQYFIVFFSDRALPMPATDLIPATPSNVGQTSAWLRSVECGGGTNPLPGLLLALALRPDAIYLLTDGKFDPQVISQVAQAQPPQPIPISTIGFASRKAERLLEEIARQTGGIYRFVK